MMQINGLSGNPRAGKFVDDGGRLSGSVQFPTKLALGGVIFWAKNIHSNRPGYDFRQRVTNYHPLGEIFIWKISN